MISLVVFQFTATLLWTSFPIKAQVKEWKIPCGAPYKPRNCENISFEALETVQDYERCAPALLDPIVRDYVWHGTGMEITLWENVEAFKKIRIKTKVLRGLQNNSLETTVLGEKIAFPVGISPTAGHLTYHSQGEIGMAKGAAKAGAIMILNYYSLTSMEDVAAAVPLGTTLWMHTYMDGGREQVIDIVRRAENAGYTALVITVDEPIDTEIKCRGREKMLHEFYSNVTYPNLLRHNLNVDPKLTFDDLKWLITKTKLPVIAKGILTKEDAIQAIAVGVSGIFVSNHGGRGLDGSLSSIDALPEIVNAVHAVNPSIEIYVDGGIRSGYDVYKALAVGAKAAFIGRPAIWGLTIGGEEGVEKLLNIIKNEFRLVMVHAGFLNPKEITRSSLLFPICGYNYNQLNSLDASVFK